jgi:iron complex transport system ATP-binding protein
MIGKVLTQSTSVILLDEPTAFLDYSNRKKVLKLLRDLALIKEKLIVVSSHDIDLCMDYADEIIAIDSHDKQLLHFDTPFIKKEIIDLIFD